MLSKKLKRKEHFQTQFNEVSLTLVLKSDKDTINKENYRPIFLRNIDAKILHKTLIN